MKKRNTLPPRLATRLIRFLLRPDLAEEVEGDLIESFDKTMRSKSVFRARINYWHQVINYIRPFAIRKSNRTSAKLYAMLKHNIIIAIRSYLRHKSSFAINLTSLTCGLTAALLICLWVYDEYSFDQFHEKKDRLYQVMRHTPGPDNTLETHSSNSVLLPMTIADELADVEYVVPTRPAPEGILSHGETTTKGTGWFVGKDFFQAFTYKLIEGDARQVLTDKYSMVISDQVAIRLFGSTKHCVGKSINWGLDHFGDTHIVSGVFQSPHTNSSDKFDFLVTYEAFLGKNRMDVNWDSNPIIVNLTLKAGTSEGEFNGKLSRLYQAKRGKDADAMFLKKYSELYLYGRYENGKLAGGRIDYVILFSLIAAFILIIACINFMNLSTAHASRKLKEVGIKKTIGAVKSEIAVQHLTEAMIMAIFSLIASVMLAFLLLPQFSLITGKQIRMTTDWSFLAGMVLVVLATGFVAGSYPAFYLSSFRPVEVLKGKLTTSFGESWIRKGLVVFQFSVSILLIIAVAVVYLQINFIHTKSLGYNKDNLITFQKQGAIDQNLEPFLIDLKNTPGVANCSSMQGSIANITSSSWGHRWEGQLPGTSEVDFAGATVNYGLLETVGIELKEGRSYSRTFGNEDKTAILNEAAIRAMGMKDPIGKWINLFGTQREIVGVVKDFHLQAMYTPIRPLFILCSPKYTNSIVVKLESGTESKTIERIDRLFQKYNPGVPFELNFVDDEYRALYVAEQRVASLSKYFAAIAIIISCLGLFGMAAFTVERRTKEIGIRKTLGASEFGIVRLLSIDFTAIVLLSIVISLPIAYLAASSWLSDFAYHVTLKWWFFTGTGILALMVAWITVGSQTMKAAKINPVNCLKSE